MTILVDEAIWPWRGERWAHLVSDESVAELHEFSRAAGVRRLSFSGDHYDVTTAVRLRAIELGAEPTESREIVRRLRDAGLRRRNVGRWRELAAVPVEDLASGLAPLVPASAFEQVSVLAAQLLGAEPTAAARIITRDDEIIAATTTRQESEGWVGERCELRVTPHEDLWFSEIATDRVR